MTTQDNIEQELTLSFEMYGMRWLKWLDGIITENREEKMRIEKRECEGRRV
jgi:hypothetical protein